jgi:hypothetical protein
MGTPDYISPEQVAVYSTGADSNNDFRTHDAECAPVREKPNSVHYPAPGSTVLERVRIVSTHATQSERAKEVSSSLASGPRDSVHHLSLLLKPVDGRFRILQSTWQEFGICPTRYRHAYKLRHRAGLCADRLSRIRVPAAKALICRPDWSAPQGFLHPP